MPVKYFMMTITCKGHIIKSIIMNRRKTRSAVSQSKPSYIETRAIYSLCPYWLMCCMVNSNSELFKVSANSSLVLMGGC